jgi:prenyltransferase beta subunit
MLQVARLATRLLGDSTPLVAQFLHTQLGPNGAGRDRDGRPDLYYSIFALAGLQALDSELPLSTLRSHLASYESGEHLDLVHLGALARCWGVAGVQHLPHGRSAEILKRIESHRSADGGYDAMPGAEHGNAYGCFVALGAYQDLGEPQPSPLRMVQCLKLLETEDGAWANTRKLKLGSTNATAAAVTLLRQLDLPIHPRVGDWLLARAHPAGGFLAMPSAPMPDLLSTATTLHALASMEVPLPAPLKERCLDFVDSLWTNRGGFHGHWADDDLDAEYTFYGLLALGHLSL